MNNFDEVKDFLEEASWALRRAERNFFEKDYPWTCQSAQVSIELSAKAIISCFTEFDWTHDPSKQLLNVQKDNKKKIGNICGKQIISQIKKMATDVKIAAPWHGISIYGIIKPGERRISSIRACTQDIAKDLLIRAKRSYKLAKKFVGLWFKKRRHF